MRLEHGGLIVGETRVPLLAGSVHYWRLDPRDWRPCLESVRALGMKLVDTYVPWGVHEIAPGELELGGRDPQRDVAAFLRIAHELGLYAIVRPGPHINAELTYFGLPERIVWDPACQARTANNNPVMLPMLPLSFPVPSYASHAFADETARYFAALTPALAPLRYPDGPIVMFQVDNEGALYFRDGAYDQDYHPDAIVRYREFLREKYGTLDALAAEYGAAEGDEAARFATINPPTRFDAKTPAELARHLDWAEFQEHLLVAAFERFAKSLAAAGLDGLPTSHNLPPGQDATPLNPARVTRAVDLVGLDYYHAANELSRALIARRTTELVARCEGLSVPAFGCEMGAGFPPFFPPLDERDSAFTVLAALAYGLRGFNVYMAVERDRWIGSPIDRHGRMRPFATFWKKLCAALEATHFFELRRRAPVRLLIPRRERRIARVMHAFGPVTGAFFSILGAGPRDSASEEDLGLGRPLAIEADTFARAFERSLDARGVPFAFVGGEDRDVVLDRAQWIVCATSGVMKPELFERLEQAAHEGARVSLGPRAPLGLDVARLATFASRVPTLVGDDPASADAAVALAIDELGLPSFACEPDNVYATVHEDEGGTPRVLFLLNGGDADCIARVTVPGAGRATDALDGTTCTARGDAIEIRLHPKSVRMLALG